MLACFNQNLGKKWTNPNVGLKMQFKKLQLKVKVEVGEKKINKNFNPTFGVVHIWPKFGFKQPSIVSSAVVVLWHLDMTLFGPVMCTLTGDLQM